MKNFKFRMQTVLDQRERVETVARQTFAEADAAWQRGKTLLGDLCEIRDALLTELCRVSAESGFDPSEMRLYQDYLQTIMASIREQEDWVREALLRREASKLHLVGAAKNKQVLAGVRDRQQQAHTVERQRAEQNSVDEMASMRHGWGQSVQEGA